MVAFFFTKAFVKTIFEKQNSFLKQSFLSLFTYCLDWKLFTYCLNWKQYIYKVCFPREKGKNLIKKLLLK